MSMMAYIIDFFSDPDIFIFYASKLLALGYHYWLLFILFD